MLPILPLLSSQQTASYTGQFKCVGFFEHAINLQASTGELLTLHRYNKGVSPFGWLLRAEDFDDVHERIVPGDDVNLWTDRLEHENFVIDRKARSISCILPEGSRVQLMPATITAVLSELDEQTGQFGSLQQIVQTSVDGELLTLRDRYLAWLSGEKVDWSPFIGKGIGLTPSYDDTLIGMLFVSFCDPRVYALMQQILPPLISESVQKKLPLLTTYVSVAYYQAALMGAFSTPLLRLARALHSHNKAKIDHIIQQVVCLGHTSGVDTLLGIWLGGEAMSIFFKNDNMYMHAGYS